MKILLLLMTSGLLLSCSGKQKRDFRKILVEGQDDPRETTKSNPELHKYLERIGRDTGLGIEDLPINFSNLFERVEGEIGTVGRCTIYIKGNDLAKYTWAEIHIDRSYWNEELKDKPLRREQLVAHEYGHCHKRLLREHNDNHDDDGKPHSIMRSWVFGDWETETFYEPLRDYYINELMGD